MDPSLRIVYLEDDPGDVRFVRDTLRDACLDADLVSADNRADFVAALERGADLILADYSLPTFDGREALEHCRRYCPHCPFIFVSGALGEERAIELVHGATDYVLKDRLGRLGSSIRRALAEAEDAAAHERPRKGPAAGRKNRAIPRPNGSRGSVAGSGTPPRTSSPVRMSSIASMGWSRASSRCPPSTSKRGHSMPRPTGSACTGAAGGERLETGVACELDLPAVRHGEAIWVTARGEAVRDAEERIIGLRGTVQDVTERIGTEKAASRPHGPPPRPRTRPRASFSPTSATSCERP